MSVCPAGSLWSRSRILLCQSLFWSYPSWSMQTCAGSSLLPAMGIFPWWDTHTQRGMDTRTHITRAQSRINMYNLNEYFFPPHSLCLTRVFCASWLTLQQGWSIWVHMAFCTGTWLHATACESTRGCHSVSVYTWEPHIRPPCSKEDCICPHHLYSAWTYYEMDATNNFNEDG